jgi:hypothetical protein
MQNEDYDRELLASVALICTAVSVVAGLFETSPPAARPVGQPAARFEQLTPVRVIGTPLVLNRDPSVRLAKD